MALTLAVASALARQCAPDVAPTTMVALVVNESALDPLVIGDNTSHRTYRSATQRDAEGLARSLIAQGHSIDMGLAQINNRTAHTIGLPIGDAFDACASMAAAGRLMVATYRRVAPAAPTIQHALAATLSTYNTGNSVRGIENGYVARVYRAASRTAAVPASPSVSITYAVSRKITPSGGDTAVAGEMPENTTRQDPSLVFGVSASNADVFAAPPKGR